MIVLVIVGILKSVSRLVFKTSPSTSPERCALPYNKWKVAENALTSGLIGSIKTVSPNYPMLD